MLRFCSVLLLVVGCGEEFAESPCAIESRGGPLSVGNSFDDGDLAVEVVQLNPNEVRVGLNTWTLSLDGDDEGCSLTVTPVMPDHGHGSSVGAVTEKANGDWLIQDLRISMGGYWQVQLERTCPESTQAVTMGFCVDA